MKDLKYDGSAGSYFVLNIQDFFVEYIIKQHLLIIDKYIYIYIYTNNIYTYILNIYILYISISIYIYIYMYI